MTTTRLYYGDASAELLRAFPVDPSRSVRVGVSGGIGSGKSTLREAFRRHGAIVADADAFARALYQPGSALLCQLADDFGPQVITADGGVDRAALAAIVFADLEKRRHLESLTHPLIADMAEATLSQAGAGQLAVYDVPLLVEKDMASQFDVVVMVNAPIDQRLLRLESRGMGRADAQRRIAAQATSDQRREVTHIWVDNAGTPADLEELTGLIVSQWLRPPTT